MAAGAVSGRYKEVSKRGLCAVVLAKSQCEDDGVPQIGGTVIEEAGSGEELDALAGLDCRNCRCSGCVVTSVDSPHNSVCLVHGHSGCGDRRQRRGQPGIPGDALDGNGPGGCWSCLDRCSVVGFIHQSDWCSLDVLDRGKRSCHRVRLGPAAQHRRPPACGAVTLTQHTAEAEGARRAPSGLGPEASTREYT